MLTLETRMDGVLRGYVHAGNRSTSIFHDGKLQCLYYVEYHRFGAHINPKEIHFDVAHFKEDGVEKLTSLIYRDINKILEKRKATKLSPLNGNLTFETKIGDGLISKILVNGDDVVLRGQNQMDYARFEDDVNPKNIKFDVVYWGEENVEKLIFSVYGEINKILTKTQ